MCPFSEFHDTQRKDEEDDCGTEVSLPYILSSVDFLTANEEMTVSISLLQITL